MPNVFNQFYEKIFQEFNLTVSDYLTIPEEGRIANHLHVKCVQHGDILIRLYPVGYEQEKNESGCVAFEVESLQYLNSKGISVPQPLQFQDGSLLKQFNNTYVFAYRFIPGRCLKQHELSVDIAEKCGQYLNKFIDCTIDFTPKQTAPEGDLRHILKGYHNVLKKYSQLQNLVTFHEMYRYITEEPLLKDLSHLPQGIVHADFFFENIVVNDNEISLIDFGDAYYGCLAMDIVIGSMEFCVNENKDWNFDMFIAFLNPHKEWLKKYQINFELYLSLLKLNCLRFAVYTLPFDIEESKHIEDNSYITRYKLLNSQYFSQNLRRISSGILYK